MKITKLFLVEISEDEKFVLDPSEKGETETILDMLREQGRITENELLQIEMTLAEGE